jgi:hypothetical protein
MLLNGIMPEMHGFKFIDYVLEFLREWTVENFAFALPYEF